MLADVSLTPTEFTGVVLGTIALLCLVVVVLARLVPLERLQRWGDWPW